MPYIISKMGRGDEQSVGGAALMFGGARRTAANVNHAKQSRWLNELPVRNGKGLLELIERIDDTDKLKESFEKPEHSSLFGANFVLAQTSVVVDPTSASGGKFWYAQLLLNVQSSKPVLYTEVMYESVTRRYSPRFSLSDRFVDMHEPCQKINQLMSKKIKKGYIQTEDGLAPKYLSPDTALDTANIALHKILS